MTPLNEEQLHQMRDERREQIVKAALTVFSRRGIVGTKMSMIAAEAGISQGLFYNYYKSKDELFISLVRTAVNESYSSFVQIHSAPGSARDRIKLLTEMILDESGRPYFLLMFQANASEGIPEEVKQLISQYTMKSYVDQLLPLFHEAQQAGDVVAGNLEEMVAQYISVVSGVMVLTSQEGNGYLSPTADMLLRMIFTQND